ncbi:MAG: type I methionyl aminopeptidase [Erysipelotrichaceae bacterium]|nr:type I methionyl aminopeptidase [Erysipelotrichaceae bacterium]
MITLKSQIEIETMREAGRIVGLAHEAVAKAIRPGVTTLELNAVAEKVIRDHGAIPSFLGYGGFPASICASINDVLVHGIPDHTRLKDGDIISIDIGAVYKGYHGDSAWTHAVGEISDEAKNLMKVTRESLFIGLQQAKPGNRLGDICHAIGEYVESHGYSVPVDYTGHGIGTELHEEPAIPNYGRVGRGVLLKEGMTLAIEPMVHAGKPQTRVLQDDWTVVSKDGSLAAHYEHTIVITSTGYEILTINHFEGGNAL